MNIPLGSSEWSWSRSNYWGCECIEKEEAEKEQEGEEKEEEKEEGGGGGEGKEDEKEEENSESSALHSLMHHSRSCIHHCNALEWNFILK